MYENVDECLISSRHLTFIRVYSKVNYVHWYASLSLGQGKKPTTFKSIFFLPTPTLVVMSRGTLFDSVDYIHM